MVKVRFYGALKQFGATFELDAETPAECIKALTSQTPKLREFIQQGLFTVRIGREYVDNRYLEKGLFYKLKTGMTVHLTPVLKGAKKGGIFQAIVGVALIGAAFMLGPVGFAALSSNAAWLIGGIGASMLLGGVTQMLTKQPDISNKNETEKKQSTAFSNRANMTAQGRMVPLAYGRILTGSMVISQGVRTVDVDVFKTQEREVGFRKGQL
ncbi:tail assembly protein [Avibacterium paragallinarum]|uniref:Phage-related protein, tail component n=1 Tax=Avibacterium paragallinarum TaxID=728 RepID=A0A0F5EYK9_AVIPA|nr:tail assembly protein [Avibacterium paragallinarum]KAA6208602.1 tail assembly protein [Avibacterium paragallinarum]KKB01475.1 tail protein [Avibacterium paragallinarum]RZN69986.1 tail assembly protein [Avibacterium paragallinarum]SUU97068.1 Phage-related protein, tail component [Avibacterium paragallinarum]